MPQFQVVTQAPLISFISIFLMLGGVVLLLFGLGVVQSGTGQDIVVKIKSGRKTSLMGLVGIILGGAGILWSVLASELKSSPTSATEPDKPGLTDTTEPTSTAISIDADPSMYDDFNDPQFNGSLNTNLWRPSVTSPGYIEQQDGVVVLSLEPGTDEGANLYANLNLLANQSHFIESKILLSRDRPGEDGDVGFGLVTDLGDDQQLVLVCLIYRQGPQVGCEAYGRSDVPGYNVVGGMTDYDTWHTVRIEMDSDINVTYYVDGQQIGTYQPDDAEQIKGRSFMPRLAVWSPKRDGIEAHFDDVRIGQLDE